MNEYIKSSFEYKKIKCCLSEYYIERVNYMIREILSSKPWKRAWEEIVWWSNSKWWFYNYNLTEKSTFPEWSKFFFEKSKYSKELLNILNKSYSKNLTKRQANALEQAFRNFLQEIDEYKYRYKEDFFTKNIENSHNFYDTDWNIID